MSPAATASRASRASPAGDLEVLAAADELLDAVHDLDAARVQAAFDTWCARYDGDPGTAARALAVLLAAAVPHDAPLSDLTAWVDDPARYARLRSTGMAPSQVMATFAYLEQRGRT